MKERNELFIKNIKRLIKMRNDGLLGGEVMPEDALIGVVLEEDLLNVLTLGMALNYQRSAYQLWQSVADAYLDKSTSWIFEPKDASEIDIDKLSEKLLFHRVALQPKRHPQIWQRVAKGIIQSSENGDVLGLLESAEFDIARLIDIMQVRRKSEFPYLSGPKIFNYWLHIIELYGGVHLKSRELITIAPDTHVLKATVKLGLCSPKVLNGTAENRKVVAEAWKEALAGSGIAPIDIHTPLWLWSRAGFPGIGNMS